VRGSPGLGGWRPWQGWGGKILSRKTPSKPTTSGIAVDMVHREMKKEGWVRGGPSRGGGGHRGLSIGGRPLLETGQFGGKMIPLRGPWTLDLEIG